MNCTYQLKNLKNVKYTHLVKTMYEVQTQLISVNDTYNKGIDFCYALLIFIVNMHGLFLNTNVLRKILDKPKRRLWSETLATRATFEG